MQETKNLSHLATGAFAVAGILGCGMGYADEQVETLAPSVVYSKSDYLIGEVDAASSGVAGRDELSRRPILRRGELLEVVPGMIVTQHAGGGKANQYFVRGFNLDHGTDFHVGLDGMPANYRTHGHGQGYADINFIVPEFVERLDYGKGPFDTRFGDLSTAGHAEYQLYDVLPEGMLSLSYGSYDYYRFLYGDSWALGRGHLSFGMEYSHENGPWKKGDDFDRYNIFARYHVGDADNYWNSTFLAYQGQWDSSDQIPLRAVEGGLLDRYDAVDPTTGGESSRYSLSSQWQMSEGGTKTHLDTWVGYYDMELFSNFTYNLNDPVRGDQFEQSDSRIFAGFDLWHEWEHEVFGREARTRVGLQSRNDWINDIGLHLTEARDRYETIRKDDVYVGSLGVYVDHETRINDWLKVGGGLRGDGFRFKVDSDLEANSGSETDGIVSPKFRVVMGPWNETEFYFNAGLGFHSNDARGVTIEVDPTDGVTPLDQVDPLVRTKGLEWGVRSNAVENLTTTLALWYLESDSELVYVGDAGTSEAGDGSERWGVELAAYWHANDWIHLDGEYSWSHAQFVGVPSGMKDIPNAVEHAVSAGITLGREEGYFGSLRARYFTPRPLEESGSVKSDESFIVNARVGYRKENWEVSLDVLNVLDRNDNDIEYYYESRLPSEMNGVEGKHIHPAEPRQVRLNVVYRF
ncbi:hypothetical protein Rhal01_02785 [Rubritalea halochordaticola]|uniref:TonB-dependent receptor plug domain-containing protein n=1 Tax=Rubritalea halochordaticola TaxID=714537 RepID=A0ABP9V3K0_9BACT